MADPRRGAVFLLTDYGVEDEFAGLTRAVVLREAPEAVVVDLTHGVPPFDVRAGALILARSVKFLGPGVVVAVVDPGVGSERRAVAVEVRGSTDGPLGGSRTDAGGPRHLVGPDNGLLGWAIEALGGAVAAVALAAPGTPGGTPGSDRGSTFDGRDLFAPVAGRLWSGARIDEVGRAIDPGSLVRLPDPLVEVAAGSIEAEVLWIDRFGNVQLAAGADDAERAGFGAGLGTGIEIRAGTGPSGRGPWAGRRVGSFGELGEGELGLMVDANGQLALVCDRRSAATVLGVRSGETVRLSSGPSGSPGPRRST